MDQVIDFLKGRGAEIHLGQLLPGVDFCVVLGGDGTMLRAAHTAAPLGIPLLGINLGLLGFLTDADKQDGFDSLEKILSGQYSREERLMLEADFPLAQSDRIALNDICVGVTGALKTFAVYVNGQHMDDIRADGIIVATPTGSTAYSLSAGGPILVPGGQMIVITPICPHSLSSRPWVISAQDEVRIVPGQDSPLFLDGYNRGNITPSQGLTVKRSAFSASILKTAPTNFYAVLRKKKLL